MAKRNLDAEEKQLVGDSVDEAEIPELTDINDRLNNPKKYWNATPKPLENRRFVEDSKNITKILDLPLLLGGPEDDKFFWIHKSDLTPRYNDVPHFGLWKRLKNGECIKYILVKNEKPNIEFKPNNGVRSEWHESFRQSFVRIEVKPVFNGNGNVEVAEPQTFEKIMKYNQ